MTTFVSVIFTALFGLFALIQDGCVAQQLISMNPGDIQSITTSNYPITYTYPTGLDATLQFTQANGGMDWRLSCQYNIGCDTLLSSTNRFSYIRYTWNSTTWQKLPCGSRAVTDIPARVASFALQIVFEADYYNGKAVRCNVTAVPGTTTATTAGAITAATTTTVRTTAATTTAATTTAATSSVTTTPAPTASGCLCGRNPAATDRIVNGLSTTIQSRPWQVALIQESSTTPGSYYQFCGGTLVNSLWVLTAGHCIDTPPKNLKIIAGTSTLSGESVPGARQIIAVDKIVLHPQYSESPNVINDIALLRLATPAKFTDYVQPACLPYLDRIPPEYPSWNTDKATARISGWGTTKYGDSSSSPTQLLGAVVQIMNNVQCGTMQPQLATSLNSNMICGYNATALSDTCQGDSGGPLTVDDSKSNTYVVGVVSFGLGCGGLNYPGVYTKVSNFMTGFVLPTINTNTPGVTMCYP